MDVSNGVAVYGQPLSPCPQTRNIHLQQNPLVYGHFDIVIRGDLFFILKFVLRLQFNFEY